MRVPLMWLNFEQINILPKRLDNIGRMLNSTFPSTGYDVALLGDITPERYMLGVAISTLIWGVLFASFAIILLLSRSYSVPTALGIGILSGGIVGFIMFGYYLVYPRILINKIGRKVDEELIFVLKDMIVQLNSGIPIYNVLYNIGESEYKYINTYFKDVIKKTTQGHDIKVALSELATKTKSHYLKKVLWGLIIGLTSGSNIVVMIEKIHNLLVTKRIERINRYNGELQIISLLYLLFGAVLPSLGITLMLLFSIFSK